MAFNANPTGYFGTGITVNSTGITIPYSTLESYKVGTSGDVRELVYSFLEKVSDVYVNLASPTTGVTPSRSPALNVSRTTTVVDNETLRKTYTVSIDLNIGTLDVLDALDPTNS